MLLLPRVAFQFDYWRLPRATNSQSFAGRVGESMEASKHLLDLFSSRHAGGGYGSGGGTGAGVDTVIDSASSVHRAGSR